MFYLNDFNLDIFDTKDIINEYYRFKIEESGLTNKKLIEKAAISQATFTRAKKYGFCESETVLLALRKYFNSPLVSLETKMKLNELTNRIYNAVYFETQASEEIILKELMEILPLVENTPYEILASAIISIAFNSRLYPKSLDYLKNKLSILEFFKDKVDNELKFLILYSLYEYSIHIQDMKYSSTLVLELESLQKILPDNLKVFCSFILMNYYTFASDALNGLKYSQSALELQGKYFCYQIRCAIIAHELRCYNMLKNYDKVIDVAKSELFHQQYNLENQQYFLTTLITLTSAYLINADYKEAAKCINTLEAFKIENHPVIAPPLVDHLNKKKEAYRIAKLFMYYKLDDMDKYIILRNDLYQEKDNMKLPFINIIDLFIKNNKTSIKQVKKILEDEANKAVFTGAYADIYYCINAEYEKKKKRFE